VVIQIALLDLPHLLADVVREAFHGDPELVVEVLEDGSGVQGILAAHPDVAIVGLADPTHYPAAERLLRQWPYLDLFAISPDARQAWIHELVPTARPLAEVSADSLRWAVRRGHEGRST
jgi:hypothetical protein